MIRVIEYFKLDREELVPTGKGLDFDLVTVRLDDGGEITFTRGEWERLKKEMMG